MSENEPGVQTGVESATALRLILCDINIDVVDALRGAFVDCAAIEVRWGDLIQVEADAYAVPTDTYGQMNARLLQSLQARFGMGLETRLVRAIMMAGGQMEMRNALIVETEDAKTPYLLVTPTISARESERVESALKAGFTVGNSAEQAIETEANPSDTKTIASEINLNPARDAMRALLVAAQATARAYPETLTVLACPGLCTGHLGMPPEIAARQMRAAVDEYLDKHQ